MSASQIGLQPTPWPSSLISNMDKLYPIVRRVRRPLLPEEPSIAKPPETPAPELMPADATAIEQPQQTDADAPEN